MADEKAVAGADRRRVALHQPYGVEGFHRKHKHLKHHEAVEIIRETKGDRKKADAIAERKRVSTRAKVFL
jgi:hypothetical protein